MAELIADGFTPSVRMMPPEPYHDVVMTLCGDQLERYDTLMDEVPHYRILATMEQRLYEAERERERQARAAKK